MSVYALENTLPELMRSNIIDTRDLIKRADEIEGDLVNLDEDHHDYEDDKKELQDELDEINAILKEVEGYAGDSPRDGVMLVADSYWVSYAQELAEEIGAVNANASWPNNHIDWKAAADDLQQDYTSVDIGGEDWWFR